MNLFQKEKKFGFWINKKIDNLKNVPSFYSISGTKPLDILLPNNFQTVYDIGLIKQINSNNQKIDEKSMTKSPEKIKKTDISQKIENAEKVDNQQKFAEIVIVTPPGLLSLIHI